MTDSKALIERLRDTACQGVELAIKNGRFVSPHEAADRIEELEADNARLREALTGMLACLSFSERWQDNHPEYVTAARAALQETSHD